MHCRLRIRERAAEHHHQSLRTSALGSGAPSAARAPDSVLLRTDHRTTTRPGHISEGIFKASAQLRDLNASIATNRDKDKHEWEAAFHQTQAQLRDLNASVTLTLTLTLTLTRGGAHLSVVLLMFNLSS